MTRGTLDESQRKAARVAGFALLFAIAIVAVANYGISFRLIVPGNAAQTARNIAANAFLFRVNVACDLVYVVTVIVLLASLYVILKPVDRHLALVATFCRLVLPLMWGVAALDMLGALRLLGDAAYLPVFTAEQLQTLSRLRLAEGYDAYYVGLPFWGLASTFCSYLWFKSRYVPRSLAAFGLIASAWCVVCAFAYLVSPGFAKVVGPSWFDVPMVMFETAIGAWLVFRGLRPSGTAPRRSGATLPSSAASAGEHGFDEESIA
jgi:hypothetical protein